MTTQSRTGMNREEIISSCMWIVLSMEGSLFALGGVLDALFLCQLCQQFDCSSNTGPLGCEVIRQESSSTMPQQWPTSTTRGGTIGHNSMRSRTDFVFCRTACYCYIYSYSRCVKLPMYLVSGSWGIISYLRYSKFFATSGGTPGFDCLASRFKHNLVCWSRDPLTFAVDAHCN